MNSHSHNHHGGRTRKNNPRFSAAQGHKQFRNLRTPKEFHVEAPHVTAFKRDFEAARSFDLEDDEIFCPFHLLTEDDVSGQGGDSRHRSAASSVRDIGLTFDDQLQSIHSSGSDRSSLSSGSPEQSPLQHQLQPTPSFVLSSAPNPYTPAGFQQSNSSQTKLHQPLAQRTRNAIPIVDPSTRAVASPPPSVSPNRQMQQQFMSRRW
ncbi:hypothetical protein BDV96DRAFT_641485 [Lophiotrema nucula]|uniref:Uncharacterized protein n=1 Tax=Lophiotrema nucula TaxID=690887 RepID=A0A6A5ZME0_9PLEO|nr:hypothetical protein BDV96DRAFT_641485 [Lophiotrema nucula]